MPNVTAIGYAGKILRVDLSGQKTGSDELDEKTVEKWVGGVGFGAKYLYEEVSPGVQWDDPENRLVWTTGPLAGTGVAGWPWRNPGRWRLFRWGRHGRW